MIVCPACGRPTLLVETRIQVQPQQLTPTKYGTIWGNLTPDWPILMASFDPAYCNRRDCDWAGTVADLA